MRHSVFLMCFFLFFFFSLNDINYRHVLLPNDLARQVPKSHLMTETEWRNLGVQQSPGWVHYMLHAPEPHVLLFRRPLPKQEDNNEPTNATTSTSSVQNANGTAKDEVGCLI